MSAVNFFCTPQVERTQVESQDIYHTDICAKRAMSPLHYMFVTLRSCWEVEGALVQLQAKKLCLW